MKLLIPFIFLAACSQTPGVYTKRLPAQASDYVACHDIKTQMLIPRVDISSMPKNFKNVKELVFKNNCASCHFGADSYRPHLDDYTTVMEVVNLAKPLESVLWTTIIQNKMPPSYSLGSREPQTQRFLKAWLEAGAPRD
jgi:hypothetical protein